MRTMGRSPQVQILRGCAETLTRQKKKKNTLMQFLEVKINAKNKKPTVNNYQKFKYRHDLTLHDSASP